MNQLIPVLLQDQNVQMQSFLRKASGYEEFQVERSRKCHMPYDIGRRNIVGRLPLTGLELSLPRLNVLDP